MKQFASIFIIVLSLNSTFSTACVEHVQDHKLNAVIYQQRASEYRALCYQAFNSAKSELTLQVHRATSNRNRLAVVVDVDETIIDNSAYEVFLLNQNKAIPFKYDEWLNSAQGTPLPGAIDFLKFANDVGVRVFYVTNRKSVYQAATIKNLKSFGLSDISEETVLVRTTENSKEPRRELIRRNYEIALLIGDNLIDLAPQFEIKESPARIAEVDKNRDSFGSKFIVLPNAIYGDWESISGDLKGLSESEKRIQRLKSLSQYSGN